jgi:pimeloyl-ACP methyl ester carboxylesterase
MRHIARAWVVLMKRPGYTSFVAQGGDWGAVIVDLMATQGHPELLGIHTNMPGIFPADIDGGGLVRRAAPSGLSADEKRAHERLQFVVAVSVFPDELYPAPRSWAEQAYPRLIHHNKVEKGGHFAAWEQPQLFSEEVRVGFRSLRK